MMQDVNFNMMPVEVSFKPSGKVWTGRCRSLDIMTQGETFERAKANLSEAIILFFDSCLRRGTLETILKEAGYSKTLINTIMEEVKELAPFLPVEQG